MVAKTLVLAALLAALMTPLPAPAQATPRAGGVLKVAAMGEPPPTLDMSTSTAVIVYEIMWHVNESLFAYTRPAK
jgi:hypothetical protein